jgi:hypothetical protein
MGGRLLLAHADAAELDLLRRAGTLHVIGETNSFETVRAAVAAATRDEPPRPEVSDSSA